MDELVPVSDDTVLPVSLIESETLSLDNHVRRDVSNHMTSSYPPEINSDVQQKTLVAILNSLHEIQEKMESGLGSLTASLEHQSRRIANLELSVTTKTLRDNFGMPSCSSHGVHRYAKQRRDYYFQKFMENMMELWSLQRQDCPVDNGVCEADEDIANEHQIKTLIRDAEDCLRIVQNEEARLHKEYESYEFKNQDCIVYRTLWIPKDMPVTEKLDFRQTEVSLGGGETASFEKATIQYINEHFKQNDIYRVPPFCFFTDKISISKKNTKKDLTLHSDEELRQLEGLRKEQIDSLLAERNADRAVEKVVNVLQNWAKEEEDNMFIFTNYKYKDYLKNVKSVHVTDIKGDHDIMAISERQGVLFFQVKSCEPTENDLNIQNKIRFAFYQTMKDKFVFLQSNRDLSYVTSELPIYGFATLPNLTQDDIDKHFLCLYHMSLLLIEPSLKTVGVFSKWIRRAFSAVRNSATLDPVFTHTQFRELCGRYVGLASSVTVPTFSASIHKTGQKLRLNFLTPVQKKVRDSNHSFVIISGDSGAGKSLILAAKARLILREAADQKVKCHVNIVTCTDINDSLFCALKMSYQSSQQLEKYLRGENDITVSQFRVFHEEEGPNFKVTPSLLVRLIIKLTTVKDGIKQHVLMDEVPYELLKQSQWHLDDVTELVPPESKVWLTVSTHTYRVDLRSAREPCWIKEHMPKKFHFEYLDFVKRVPMSLFKVIKEMQAITGDGHGEFSKCGHVIEGPKPLLYRLRKCTCQHGPMVDYMRCQCVDERMYETMKMVFRDLKSIEDKKDITIVVHNFAIHGTSFQDLQRLLNGTFVKMGIPLVWSTVLFKSSDEVAADSLSDSDRSASIVDKQITHRNFDFEEKVSMERTIEKKVQHGTGNLMKQNDTTGNVSKNDDIHNRCHTKESVPNDCDQMRSSDAQEASDMKDKESSEFKDFQTPIMVVDTRTFVGCEGKILISLDQCGMFQHFPSQDGVGWHRISLVRCVAQYIYVTWPEQEAAQNWRKYITEYEMDVFSRNNLTEEQLDFRRNQIRQGREASNKPSCLEKLLAKNLIEEKLP